MPGAIWGFNHAHLARQRPCNAQRADGIFNMIKQPEQQCDIELPDLARIETEQIGTQGAKIVEAIGAPDQRASVHMFLTRIHAQHFAAAHACKVAGEISLVAGDVDGAEAAPAFGRDGLECFHQHGKACGMDSGDMRGRARRQHFAVGQLEAIKPFFASEYFEQL